MTPNFISGGGKTGEAIYYPFIKDIGIHEMRRATKYGGGGYLPTYQTPVQTFSNIFSCCQLNSLGLVFPVGQMKKLPHFYY